MVPAVVDPKPPVLDIAVVARLQELATQVARPGEDILGDLFRLFWQDSEKRLEAIRTALNEDRTLEASRAAHALKGAAGNVGAVEVMALAGSLERELAAGIVDAAKVDGLATALAQAVTALRVELVPR